MSTTAPIIASSSSTISLPSREMTGTRLFQFYMESFFKIPKDLKNDIIYCQRALKAHIKVHQMVIDVFQQQPDADPQQKKRILEELETEIYEINAEQQFLFLRLRRIIDEFYKMLKKNGIPTDPRATNALVSKEIIPLVNETSVEILPITVLYRYTEEKLIEKYFEVQKDQQQQPQPQQQQQHKQQRNQQQQLLQQQQYQNYSNMEVIDLDDDGGVLEKVAKVHGKYRGSKREYPSSSSSSANGESLLRNFNVGFNATLSQTSLLKPMNQRMPHELMAMDIKPKVSRNSTTTLADIYKQQKEEKEKSIELPVSTNVKMSRMNLRQALKRAQAARGPVSSSIIIPPPPPPLPPAPQPPAPKIVNTQNIEVIKKSSVAKTKASRAAAAAASVTAAQKSPERSSSSGEGTPERGPTPPHNYWPDEFEETRTKAEEYGQEMFLRMFDLFTPETHAKMQQRRSKRRRRCAQNTNYHYGKIEHSQSSTNEPDAKKKRKAFLLSPQVKKALPPKPRAKRRSADNVAEATSVPPSRSASSSPDDKRSCNECLKGGYNLEQCEECKLFYHVQCHREKDDPIRSGAPKKMQNETKLCPACKRKQDKVIQQKISKNKNLQSCVQELELQFAKEKDRREILQRTGKSYKIQMNNLFKIVNAFKTEAELKSSTSSNANNTDDNDDYEIIQLD